MTDESRADRRRAERKQQKLEKQQRDQESKMRNGPVARHELGEFIRKSGHEKQYMQQQIDTLQHAVSFLKQALVFKGIITDQDVEATMSMLRKQETKEQLEVYKKQGYKREYLIQHSLKMGFDPTLFFDIIGEPEETNVEEP